MTKPLFEEVRDDVWHIMLNLYTYQQKSLRIASDNPTRNSLVDELVSLNALASIITLRVARLADKPKSSRTIKKLAKQFTVAKGSQLDQLIEHFDDAVDPVVKIRHNSIAHMKPGEISSYPLEPLDNCVVAAIEALIPLIDEFFGGVVEYRMSPGKQERSVDLRASVAVGKKVEV
jgi:hypothetical protein